MAFDFFAAIRAQGKALGPHPALMDSTTPVSVYQPGASRQDALLSQRSAAVHMQAYGGAQAIDWVYDCVNLYADAVRTAPYSLRKPDGTVLVKHKTDGTPPEHEIGPQALYDLLDKPNPYMLYDELFWLLVIDLLLVGNGYWLKWRTNDKGQPLSLYRMAPSYVKIVPDANGPGSYEYQPPGAREPIKLDAQDVIHFRRPDPSDGFYGMGVIQGAGRSMDLSLAVTDTLASYFENQASPSLIVQSERRVPREVFRKIQQQLRNKIGGSRKAGELLVLEAGLKASTLDTSAKDALFDVIAKMDRDRIYSKFRAAPELFGQSSGTGSNKVSDFRREFDNYTLRPFMDGLQRLVSDSLASAYGCEFVINYRYTAPPEEAIKIGESVAAMPGVMIREIRRQYAQFGIEESTGDPEIDNLVINVPGEELDPNGQNGLADQSLGSEPGRPPKLKNTASFGVAKVRKPSGKALADMDEMVAGVSYGFRTPLTGYRYPNGRSGDFRTEEGKALSASLRLQLAADRARITHAGRVPEGKAVTNAAGERVTVGNKLQGEQRPDDTYASERDADINAAVTYMETALADAATTLERGLLDHVDGKALRNQSDLVKRVRSSEAWKVFREQLDAVLMEGARRSITASVMTQSAAGRTPEDELDYDEIAASVIRRPEGVRGIVKTLKDRVAMRLQRALEKGDDPIPAVIQGEVQTVIRDWKTNQASSIADSEAVEAYNEATLTVAEATDSPQVYVVEEDDAPDEGCQEAGGSVWDIAYARKHRKEHPRCRRAFIPLTAGEVA
jgi:HK97 family phage portal protein